MMVRTGQNKKLGMMNYFSSFPDSPNKPEIMKLINSFQFSLSVPSDDLDIESQDERLKLLLAVCRHLDGVFFTPSSLRDSAGRILISRFAPPDPKAVMPAIPLVSESGHDGSEGAGNASDQGEEDDDEYARTPPSRERVIQRTLALTAVAARATLELDSLNGDVVDGEIHRKRILDWVAACDIDDELEPEEWKVLQRPVKKLQQQDFINSMWRVEGLAVLAWALQLHPMPVYDELVIPSDLYQSIGLFNAEAARELHQKGVLRTDDELKEIHDHLLALHWRLRDFSLRPNLMDFKAFSEKCWFGNFDISRFRLIRGDLAIGNLALNKATPDEISRVSSIAAERHVAIIWLHGQRELYSEIEAHT